MTIKKTIISEIYNKAHNYIKENPNSEEHLQHLTSKKNLLHYYRKGSIISKILPNYSSILDWGCLYGQLGFILQKANYNVTYFDVFDAHGFDPLGIKHEKVIAPPQTILPFPSATFDAVLSCGTLEHLCDYRGKSDRAYTHFEEDAKFAIEEIARILKTNGYFFIFNLPNKFSYNEFLNELRGYKSHYIRFNREQIIKLFNEKFIINRLKRTGMLPNSLAGFPNRFRSFYNRFAIISMMIDIIISSIPLLNKFCQNYEINLIKRRNLFNSSNITIFQSF